MSVELVSEDRNRELEDLADAVQQILTVWQYSAAKTSRDNLAWMIVNIYEQNSKRFVGHESLKYLTLGVLWSGVVGVAITHPNDILAKEIARVLNQDARRQQAKSTTG